ncbi:MAG: N-acetylmuramoyl-L-alanine amidase [Bacteroidetes bacterium]|nr:MAG: N-acetylmuramoyl-L-alanine amidase [Bacteroidota bacterium]
MKRKIIIFGILSVFLLYALPLHADRHGFVRKVVIDPGHGGRDPGAIGLLAKEKDIVLAISLKLGEYIEQNFDDVEVIYTRTTDEFIELRNRTQIANDNKADLFISVHCNASPSRRAFGTETFVMGLHRSKENLAVAKKENASILYEDDYLETYDGYDPNSPEANIMFSMFQNHYLNQSLTMASLVQDQFRDRAGRHDRGVKQAGFLVLYNIAMPGILVEAGFLSNDQEEKYLISETGQAHIASAIFRAFRDYKTYQDNLARQQLASANSNNNKPKAVETTQPASSQANPTPTPPLVNKPEKGNAHDITFRVQFATTSVERPIDAPEFKGMKGISFYFHEGMFKYTVGNESTLEEATLIQQKLHQNGFRDAFVVAFKNNERIAPAEAMRILNQNRQNP